MSGGKARVVLGVMADEVPKASFNVGEYLAVDYSKIDVQFKQLKSIS